MRGLPALPALPALPPSSGRCAAVHGAGHWVMMRFHAGPRPLSPPALTTLGLHVRMEMSVPTATSSGMPLHQCIHAIATAGARPRPGTHKFRVVSVCVCLGVRVRACACVFVRTCARARVRLYVYICVCWRHARAPTQTRSAHAKTWLRGAIQVGAKQVVQGALRTRRAVDVDRPATAGGRLAHDLFRDEGWKLGVCPHACD